MGVRVPLALGVAVMDCDAVPVTLALAEPVWLADPVPVCVADTDAVSEDVADTEPEEEDALVVAGADGGHGQPLHRRRRRIGAAGGGVELEDRVR